MVNPGTYLTQQDHRPFVDNANSKTQNGFMKNQGTTNVILRFDSCRIYAFKTVKTCICFSKISQKPFMLSADYQFVQQVPELVLAEQILVTFQAYQSLLHLMAT